MKKFALIFSSALLLLVVGFICTNCRTIKRSTDSKPVTHEIWDGLLKKYVDKNGFVDYKGFRSDSAALNQYLAVLEKAHPNDKYWSRDEQMAYWINAYNAYTVQLIVRNYPVKSIKDIKNGIPFVNTVWDIKFIKIEGYKYDLNNIEHNILRPVFKDARVHAAVNCASYSCPALRAEAYTAKSLNAQLDDNMKRLFTIRSGIKSPPEKQKYPRFSSGLRAILSAMAAPYAALSINIWSNPSAIKRT